MLPKTWTNPPTFTQPHPERPPVLSFFFAPAILSFVFILAVSFNDCVYVGQESIQGTARRLRGHTGAALRSFIVARRAVRIETVFTPRQ